MSELTAPWIEFATLSPLIFALICSRISSANLRWVVAVLGSLIALVLTLLCWSEFARMNVFEVIDPNSLTKMRFGRELFVIDELSAPLLPLIATLYFAVILLTPAGKLDRFPFGLSLASLSMTLGMLSSRSPLAILFFMTVQSILAGVELGQKKQNWYLFGALQILSILLIFVGWFFINLDELDSRTSITGIALFAIGLLIRCGMVPSHIGIVDLFDKASLGTALLFVTPMAGAYGLVRMVLPVAPESMLQLISIVTLASAAICTGMALFQNCLRKFYCYLALSFTSLMLFGLASQNVKGITSAMNLWVSIGLSLISLGIVIRAIEGRAGRISLDKSHGLFRLMPWAALLFLLATLASVGLPGTVGYAGVKLLVESALQQSMVYAGLVIALAIGNAVACLRVGYKLFAGAASPSEVSYTPKPLELLAISVMAALLIIGGLNKPSLEARSHAATELLDRRGKLLDVRVEEEKTDAGTSRGAQFIAPGL
jgi:NADH-quinone oxidoreductase subunit M